MDKPLEHKTVQARILEYAEAIGWTFVSQKERRDIGNLRLDIEDSRRGIGDLRLEIRERREDLDSGSLSSLRSLRLDRSRPNRAPDSSFRACGGRASFHL